MQQQSELKKLNEGLDIRDKKIIQLEGQVGHAADFIASREPTANVDSSQSKRTESSKLEETLDKVLSKLVTTFTPPQSTPRAVTYNIASKKMFVC